MIELLIENTVDLAHQLENNPDYIKRVNKSITQVSKYFNEIKGLINKPLCDENFIIAYQRFIDIFDIIPLLIVKLPMPQIVRGRPLYKDDPLCTERWQISYNWRFQDKIQIGRFNRIKEPLFYGSLPTQSEKMDYVLTCALECCKELSLEYDVPDIQDITIGGWIIENAFNVVILCFDDRHLADNPDLKLAVDNYLMTVHKYFSKEAAEFVESFFRYFSELSRTIMDGNECYKLLVPFFASIRDYADKYEYVTNEGFKEPIYGMIYPSAMTLAKGLNVVLTREAVKNFLRLDKVVVYRYKLNRSLSTWTADKCSDIIKVKNHKFKITGYIPAIID